MDTQNKIKTIKRIYAIVAIVIFVLIIYFPSSNYIFNFSTYETISTRENRKLAELPELDINKLDPFPSKYETYYNDHFIFREKLLYYHTFLNYFVFHRSPVPEKVSLGKKSWLFYADKERKVFENKFNISDNDIQKIVSEIEYRDSIFEYKNIQFVVMITPMKAEIYPEFLPSYYRRFGGENATDKVVKALQSKPQLTIIHPKQQLIEAKKFVQTYFKYDNHWNKAGAFYAYQMLIQTINHKFPQLKAHLLSPKEIKLEQTPINGGNLANMIGLENLLKEIDYSYTIRNSKSTEGVKRNYPVTPGFAYENEYEMVSANSDTLLPKALIIRDSYCVALMPYLNESFREVVYIFDAWQYKLNLDIVEKEKPDVIILQIFEPHISNILDNLSR